MKGSRMKKAAALAAIVTAAVLALAGCGGTTHQAATGSAHPPGWGSTPKGVSLPPVGFGVVPTAEMWDTITLATVPANPFALAGYTSGFWPTYLPLRAAYPAAHTISIAVNTSHHADCLDVEPGDATPAQAGQWARSDIAAGFAKPCLYSDLSEMPQVQASLASGGLSRDHYLLWLAWYRYVPGLIAGYDAVQWTDHAFGRNLDESTVTLAFLGAAQPPYVPPSPLPVCFGPRTRVRNATCRRVRSEVAKWSKARDASKRAVAGARRGLRANRCREPYRRDVCVDLGREIVPSLQQRERYFAGKVAATLKAYS